MKKTLYGLPKKVIFCKKTLMSNQRPSSTQEFSHKSLEKKTLIKRVSLKVGIMHKKKKKLILIKGKKSYLNY
jgi:hypothetical protein